MPVSGWRKKTVERQKRKLLMNEIVEVVALRLWRFPFQSLAVIAGVFPKEHVVRTNVERHFDHEKVLRNPSVSHPGSH
jgi:hypothetical protein